MLYDGFLKLFLMRCANKPRRFHYTITSQLKIKNTLTLIFATVDIVKAYGVDESCAESEQ